MCKSEKYYLELLEVSYAEAVKMLERKNGKPDFDYYTKSSFENYIKNDAKGMNHTHGYDTRRKKEYEIHHILENVYSNLSYEPTLKKNNIPYYTQKSEYLVYADVTEHAILHSLIAKETSGEIGIYGTKSILGKISNDNRIKQKIIENMSDNKLVKSEEI